MNIYQSITDRILDQLTRGQLPWRRTWQAGLPASLATGREYRGINLLSLSTTEFGSKYWLTFRQARALGGYVRKGEKASTVVYWKWRTPAELQAAKQEKGVSNPARCVPFLSYVFNLDQVDGVERPEGDVHHEPHRRLELADQLVEIMPDKPEITHALGHQPAYRPASDQIVLPHLSQFESADAYFAVLFHELLHSTGHPRRLNRFSEHEGSRLEKYSFEELVAEFGAAFLCGFCGITSPDLDAMQESYIAGWAEVFRKDSRILVRAASAAQRAADYVRGKVVVDSNTENTEDAREAATSPQLEETLH